ncbi:MFS general substrate transporter [Pyrrhoderma noxium]|uniref:MFS general substrate transporter n=1 Tax=Pyrrhoderma noxium TaxID=2282107 RepID=A0A286U772_9AGAM|nr:MFS general substrate transporter [Pyrrhoderma noxium]
MEGLSPRGIIIIVRFYHYAMFDENSKNSEDWKERLCIHITDRNFYVPPSVLYLQNQTQMSEVITQLINDEQTVEHNATDREQVESTDLAIEGGTQQVPVQFKLYKRRFSGTTSIVILSLVSGMSLPWFGPISNKTANTFNISLDKVNWLGNIVGIAYIFYSPLVPVLCSRSNIFICSLIAAIFLVLASWIRFAGTAKTLTSNEAYALLIIGQLFSTVPQVTFQVLAAKFSETWFDPKGRTTATMFMSLSGPLGNAIGQIVSPLISDIRKGILILGIVSTVVSPLVFLIGAKPPTPPSLSGSQVSPSFLTTLRAILGLLPEVTCGDSAVKSLGSSVSKSSSKQNVVAFQLGARDNSDKSLRQQKTQEELGHADAYMTMRERIDFIILFFIFGVQAASGNTFSILSDELLQPYGYSEVTAGFMGAALLFSGLAAAFLSAPLLDRVFTHHHGLVVRSLSPIIALAWLSLIWAVRPSNTAALYVISVIVGACSLTIVPIALELGCEITRNSEASSALLWLSGNFFGIILILVMSALRAPVDASPPFNMMHSLIFQGTLVCVGTGTTKAI